MVNNTVAILGNNIVISISLTDKPANQRPDFQRLSNILKNPQHPRLQPPTMSIFICGITGSQGSSIATHVLESSTTPIHGISRNPSSPAAQRLASLGAQISQGSYDNVQTLTPVLSTCKALFLNLSPSFTDPSAELATARQIIQLAKTQGVLQIIYSSGLSANNPQALPNWDPQSPIAAVMLSKHAIEEEVRAAGFKYYTILRPGSFMSNYVKPLVRMYDGLVERGCWRTAMQHDTIIPLVDVDTIGRFGAAAFQDPERFNRMEIDLADEFSSVGHVLNKLGGVTGRDLRAVYMTDEEVEQEKGTNPFVGGALMMRGLAGFVDLEKVKTWGLSASSLDAFLDREKERVLETYKQE
jgi:uncharacterized protein YbjT (DUF2867 family)